MSKFRTPNQEGVLYVKDDLTGEPFAVGGSSSLQAIDVAVVSGGGAGTQYAEGATTSPGTGTLSLARYKATPPSLTDGQMNALQLDSAGNLKVTGSISVGGTTDNSAFTAGSSSGTPAMGFYHSTIDTVTDGRAAAIAITSKRGQHSNLRTAAGVELLGQTTMAGSVPVTLASDQTPFSDTTQTGSITGAGSTVVLALNGQSTVGIQVSGIFSATLQVSLSVDGSTYTPTTIIVLTSGAIQNTITTATTGQINTAGMVSLKVSALSYTSGTATVNLRGSTSLSTIMLDNSLPVGTNTIGAVNGTGSAGTASAGVMTIQGIASMTPVQVSQATAASLNATVVGTGTFAVQSAQSGTWTVGSNSATGSAVPANAFYTGLNDGTNLVGATALADNADSIAPSTTVNKLSVLNRNVIFAAAANTWNRQKSVENAMNTSGVGTTAVGVLAQFDDVSPTSITENNFGTVRMSANRNIYGTIRDAAGNERGVNVNASNQLSVSIDGSSATNISTNISQMNGVTVTMGNGTSGTGVQRVTLASDSTGQAAPAANATATGTAIYNNTALSSTKQAVNASAGNLYGYHIYNPNTVVIYVQLFNLASASVTVGTTAPTAVLAVPAGGWADTAPGTPITFGTALTIAATTTSTGSGTPSTALLCNMWYK